MTDPEDRLAFYLWLAMMGAGIAGAIWVGNVAASIALPYLHAAAALLGFVPFLTARPIARWILGILTRRRSKRE